MPTIHVKPEFYYDLRSKLIKVGTGGLIDDHAVEIVMGDVTLKQEGAGMITLTVEREAYLDLRKKLLEAGRAGNVHDTVDSIILGDVTLKPDAPVFVGTGAS